jgi:hypothetical protein
VEKPSQGAVAYKEIERKGNFTGDVIAGFADWMVYAFMPNKGLTQVYEEIPMFLRRRDPTWGFEAMSKSQQGAGRE